MALLPALHANQDQLLLRSRRCRPLSCAWCGHCCWALPLVLPLLLLICQGMAVGLPQRGQQVMPREAARCLFCIQLKQRWAPQEWRLQQDLQQGFRLVSEGLLERTEANCGHLKALPQTFPCMPAAAQQTGSHETQAASP